MIKIFKIVWQWLDDRLGISVLLSPAKHIAPQDAKWWYVFGSATLVAFMLKAVLSGRGDELVDLAKVNLFR